VEIIVKKQKGNNQETPLGKNRKTKVEFAKEKEGKLIRNHTRKNKRKQRKGLERRGKL
jgi:hypothetical protein